MLTTERMKYEVFFSVRWLKKIEGEKKTDVVWFTIFILNGSENFVRNCSHYMLSFNDKWRVNCLKTACDYLFYLTLIYNFSCVVFNFFWEKEKGWLSTG